MRCKRHNPIKKPYKKKKIHPPAQMSNKWFFQQEIADLPLLFLMTSAMSLDRFYLNSTSISNSIGFTGLNYQLFNYHNWGTPTTHGYHPGNATFLYSFQQSTTIVKSVTEIEVQNIIYLGGTESWSPGVTIKDTPSQTAWQSKLATYASTPGLWGNLFIPHYLKNSGILLVGDKHPGDLYQYYQTENAKLTTDHFHFLQTPLLYNYRYNPFPDDGIGNQIFLTSITEVKTGWDPPADTSLTNNNLPLWLGLFGFIDWQKASKVATQIDTLRVLTLKCKYIYPDHHYIIPIDEDFLNGNSPYRPKQDPTPQDKLHWHPKLTFQYQTANAFCLSGPGVVKLPPNVSTEAHLGFKFYFKLGGCASEIKRIKDPESMPKFPTPGNLLQKPSLQSPATPLENYLYSFDWRRQYITDKALERITEHKEPETSIFKSTGINLLNPPIPQETSDSETSDAENEKETLLRLLKQHKLQQRKYKHRILRLMQSLE